MTVTPFASRIGSAAGVGRAVGALGEDPGADVPGVVGRDLALERGEHEDVDVEREQLSLSIGRARGAGDRAVLPEPPGEVRDVEAVRVEAPPPTSVIATTLAPALVEQPGRRLADVAEALDGHAWRRACRGRSGAAASSIV